MTHEREGLPLPDYDQVPIGHLPAHIAALDAESVDQLVTYEGEHGNRLPVMRVLQHRLDALRNGAEPSTGGGMPELSPEVPGGSKVTPATSGPKINPPSQGVPTNPAQPR